MVERVVTSEVTPSMMTNGSLPPNIEVVPRTRTLLSMAMRSRPFEPIFTPAVFPLSTSRALFTIPLRPISTGNSVDNTSNCLLGMVSLRACCTIEVGKKTTEDEATTEARVPDDVQEVAAREHVPAHMTATEPTTF